MKKRILTLTSVLFAVGLLFTTTAQDEPQPVYDVFNGSLFIDQQTIVGPWKGGLEFHIHHRFGTVDNGIKDVFGIYAPANIRLGMNYGITDRLMVGFGTEKDNKLQEFLVKYAILQQKESGMPISLSYFANMAIDARNSEVFGQNYKFTNRLSYFHQLIVARKFGERVSVQVAPSFTHFNAVDSIWMNDYVGISANGRVKLFGDFSLIAEYSAATSLKKKWNYMEKPEPNYAFGFEIGTPTHCFQLFAANYKEIVPQANLARNIYRIADAEILIGLNLIVRF